MVCLNNVVIFFSSEVTENNRFMYGKSRAIAAIRMRIFHKVRESNTFRHLKRNFIWQHLPGMWVHDYVIKIFLPSLYVDVLFGLYFWLMVR